MIGHIVVDSTNYTMELIDDAHGQFTLDEMGQLWVSVLKFILTDSK